jgi:hypothetical protein
MTQEAVSAHLRIASQLLVAASVSKIFWLVMEGRNPPLCNHPRRSLAWSFAVDQSFNLTDIRDELEVIGTDCFDCSVVLVDREKFCT